MHNAHLEQLILFLDTLIFVKRNRMELMTFMTFQCFVLKDEITCKFYPFMTVFRTIYRSQKYLYLIKFIKSSCTRL